MLLESRSFLFQLDMERPRMVPSPGPVSSVSFPRSPLWQGILNLLINEGRHSLVPSLASFLCVFRPPWVTRSLKCLLDGKAGEKAVSLIPVTCTFPESSDSSWITGLPFLFKVLFNRPFPLDSWVCALSDVAVPTPQRSSSLEQNFSGTGQNVSWSYLGVPVTWSTHVEAAKSIFSVHFVTLMHFEIS